LANQLIRSKSTFAQRAPNGAPFDALNSAQTMILDSAEEWRLTTDAAIAHPFHIHVNWFQVVKVNGMAAPPRWQDTVIIPLNGNVTIRHRFQQYTGRFVLHCHVLPHEVIAHDGWC
jgi:FtsP/CotA-like multicopper oxidase with cupredoxin domain